MVLLVSSINQLELLSSSCLQKIAQNQLSFRESKLWSAINLRIKNEQWDFTKQYIQPVLA